MKFRYFISARNDFHIERNPAKRYSARSTTEANLKFRPPASQREAELHSVQSKMASTQGNKGEFSGKDRSGLYIVQKGFTGMERQRLPFTSFLRRSRTSITKFEL
jgi:hypothetical protein